MLVCPKNETYAMAIAQCLLRLACCLPGVADFASHGTLRPQRLNSLCQAVRIEHVNETPQEAERLRAAALLHLATLRAECSLGSKAVEAFADAQEAATCVPGCPSC